MKDREELLKDYRYIIMDDYQDNIYDTNWRFIFSAFLHLLSNLDNGYNVYVSNMSDDINYNIVKEICSKYYIETTLLSNRVVFYVSIKRIEEYFSECVFKNRTL